MPFDGYPVFRLSPRDAPVTARRSSRRLPCPFRALTRSLPACVALRAGFRRPGPCAVRRESDAARSSPPERSLLFSACWRVGSFVVGVADPHRSSLVAFRRFQRAEPLDPRRNPRATLPAAPGLFHPGSAHELSPSGYCVRPERRPRLRGRSSRAVGRAAETAHPRLRRLRPSGERRPSRWRRTPSDPHGVVPSEALPSAAVGTGFPAPSSRVLGRLTGRTRHPSCTSESPRAADLVARVESGEALAAVPASLGLATSSLRAARRLREACR